MELPLVSFLSQFRIGLLMCPVCLVVRLENEHLGNSDQYRATREVPLPYSFDEHESEEEEVMSNKTGGGRKILRRRSVRMSSVGISSSAGSPRG